MRLSAKVLIVGGGPAGATAARFLAEAGIHVILLERNCSFTKPCGGGLSLSAFNEFGISRTIIKKEINRIRIISPKGESLDIDLIGHSLTIIERSEFDNTLRNRAEEKGAKVIEGEFLNLTHDTNYRVEAIIGEALCEIVSEYIIAADGVNSKVRKAIGLKPCQTIFAAYETIKEMQTETCEFWFGSSHAPYSYSWVFPAVEGISIGTGSFEPGIISTLLEKFKNRKGIVPEGKKRIYRIPVWTGDLYNKNKILFAGDAAGHVLPLTYEGIYYAMKAGEFAAKAILEEKVDNYKKIWKDRFQKRFTLMDKLRKYFLKDDASAEKLVALHRRHEVQQASLRLWLSKDSSKESLMSYIRLFGNFLH